MGVDYEGGKCIVSLFIDIILYNGKKIESREDWVREVNIIIKIESLVIVTVDWVCSCNNTAPSLKTSDNTSL